MSTAPRAPGMLHPFTPFLLTLGVVVLAFALPAPSGPVLLYAAVLACALGYGHARAARAGALVCLPLWAFLLLLHVVLPEGRGLAVALAQAARLGGVATASVMLFQSFRPSRFLDAVVERGWSFPAAYLVVATMQAAPRLRERAAVILEAQRARGLRLSGGPVGRIRALRPLVLPLLLGIIAEVDDRAMALEIRGTAGGEGAPRRTPLAPVPVLPLDRLLWWVTAVAIIGALIWRALR